MQVVVGQDKSNGLVTFNQVKVLFFFFFFSSMSECNYFRLLLLKNFRRSQGTGAPPRPPLAPPVIYPLVDVQVETKQGCHLQG